MAGVTSMEVTAVIGTDYRAENTSLLANISATIPSATALEAALTTLVADGASPTQAHVTAVNDAYTTYEADIATQTAAITAAQAAPVLVNVVAATVLTYSNLTRAIASVLQRFAGSGLLTP
jgi:hypothetical protein